jgi:hypothetical protein
MMGMPAQRLHRASRQTLEQCTKAVGTPLAQSTEHSSLLVRAIRTIFFAP